MGWMAFLIAGFVFMGMRADERSPTKMRVLLFSTLVLVVAWITMSTAVPALLATGGGG